jgi:hypothetical protein
MRNSVRTLNRLDPVELLKELPELMGNYSEHSELNRKHSELNRKHSDLNRKHLEIRKELPKLDIDR